MLPSLIHNPSTYQGSSPPTYPQTREQICTQKQTKPNQHHHIGPTHSPTTHHPSSSPASRSGFLRPVSGRWRCRYHHPKPPSLGCDCEASQSISTYTDSSSILPLHPVFAPRERPIRLPTVPPCSSASGRDSSPRYAAVALSTNPPQPMPSPLSRTPPMVLVQ